MAVNSENQMMSPYLHLDILTVKRETKIVKILGLNVCGIQSKLELGILEQYVQDCDFVCLSETKTSEVDDNCIPGYHPIVLSKKHGSHKLGGIHGLCIFVKKTYIDNVSIITDTKSDCILWLEVGKPIFGEKIIIGAVYLPHEGSQFHNDDIFNDLTEDIINIHTASDTPIILAGDFNSRTGKLDDFTSIDDTVAEAAGIDLADDHIFSSKHELTKLGMETPRFNQDSTVNNNGRRLIELCQMMNIKIVNGRFGSDCGIGDFTCQNASGKSTVDYVIASPELLTKITDFQVDNLDKCLSDVHSAISVTLQFCCKSSSVGPSIKPSIQNTIGNPTDNVPSSINASNFMSLKTSWDTNIKSDYINAFSRDACETLSSKLENICTENVTQAEIDELTNELCSIYIDPAKNVGICKENRKQAKKPAHCGNVRNKPWFDGHCHQKRAEYFRVKNKLNKVRTIEAKTELKNKAKEYKRVIKKAYREYNKDLHKSLRNLKCSQPKKYWDIINKACKSTNKTGNITLNEFMLHFQKLSQKPDRIVENTKNAFDPRKIHHSINEEINREFSLAEVKKIICKLKNNKAYGIDNILNEYLKNCPENVVVMLTQLFNIVLLSGVVPTDWCIGMIKPLYKKKGSVDDPDNYRGITLLSCVGKLFTACINARLTVYVEGVGIMGEEQAGFRENYSTFDHIFTLHALVDFYLHRKKRIYCAFVDYKKAFDLLDRSSLWSKLISSGINGNIVRVVFNMYDKAKSCVTQDGNMSNLFACNIGVRQGENLSPLLFAIYLNDFEYFLSRHYSGLDMCSAEIRNRLSDEDIEVFLRLYVLLYADDTIVMAETARELQKALIAVYNYCELWHLTVNTAKTKIVIFSRGKVQIYPKFSFGDSELDVVNDYVYLGTTFNYNGLFNKAICKQITQARRAMYSLIESEKTLPASRYSV